MKKFISLCLILTIIFIAGFSSINIFAKTANQSVKLKIGESFKVTKDEGGFVGITWSYKNSNPDIITLDYEVTKQIPNTADMLLPHTWSFKAIKPGTVTLTFTPSRNIADEVTYKITVNKNKVITTEPISSSTPVITKNDSKNFDQKKVLFIEEFTKKDGIELVEGPKPPILAIDFPTYSFANNTLTSMVKSFDLTNDILAIKGTYNCLSGYCGMGAASGLTPITTETKATNFTISSDGTAKFLYENDWLTVAPGEEMVLQKESLSKVADSTIRVKLTKTYHNFGFIDKNNIIFPN